MRLVSSNDISALLRDEALPSVPCSIDSGTGLAYYQGTDADIVRHSPARAIICRPTVADQVTDDDLSAQLIVTSDNPLLTFTQIARVQYSHLLQPRALWTRNPDGSIPKNTIINAGAVVYDNVTLGDDCVIGANCVIGDAGFGFSCDADGEYVSAPHFGGVRIGNNVEIGPGCVIDCGSYGDTLIDSNTRLDNLVQIAHNVKVGTGTRVMATVSISGGVSIGQDCWIAPGAVVRDKISIGDHVLVGAGSVVTVDIPSHHRYQPDYAAAHICEPDSDWEAKL